MGLQRALSGMGMDRNLLNLKHAAAPLIGDYWNEMFTPIGVVVDVTEFTVVLCESQKLVGDGWSWDLSKLKAYSRKEFVNRFRYGRIGNADFEAGDDMSDIKNKFWCDVSPEAHKEVRVEAVTVA